MANKDKQIEKRNQEMARRKAEAEARENERKAKQKKKLIIVIVAAVLVVAIACGVGIPLGIKQNNKYMKVDFKKLAVPTTVAEAQSSGLVPYNGKNVVMEGYAFPCGSNKYYVLCKEEVATCPYVTGTVPNNGVRMEMKDGTRFNLYSNARVRIWGTMKINTVAVEKFEGQETYMYLIIDKVEEI